METCRADERPTLEARVKVMQETDMAVVVSQSQNEIEDIKKKGADITPHRKRMLAEDLDEKFKDPESIAGGDNTHHLFGVEFRWRF